MWILILTLQFFVYMSSWQVRYPGTLHFIFYELKRVALGEFVDDLDVGCTVMEAMGMPPNDSQGTDEKVGEERLGISSPLQSFGVTLLLSSILFATLMLVVIALIVILRRSSPSVKCRERVNKYKVFIFFNPIIRYLILNSLKLNMVGLVVFKTKGKPVDILVAIAILALVNGAPIIFYITVKSQKTKLEQKESR